MIEMYSFALLVSLLAALVAPAASDCSKRGSTQGLYVYPSLITTLNSSSDRGNAVSHCSISSANTMAAVRESGQALLWYNVGLGNIATLSSNPSCLNTTLVATSPTNSHVAVGCKMTLIYLHSVDSNNKLGIGIPINLPSGPLNYPSALAFDPTGTYLAIGLRSNPTLYMMKLSTLELASPGGYIFVGCSSVAWFPHRELMVLGASWWQQLQNPSWIAVVNTTQFPGKVIQTFGVDSGVRALAVHPAGSLVVAVTHLSWQLFVYKLEDSGNLTLSDVVPLLSGAPRSLAFHPSGALLAVGTQANRVLLVPTVDGRFSQSASLLLTASEDTVADTKCVAFTNDGEVLMTGGSDIKAHLTAGAPATLGQTLSQGASRRGLAFNPRDQSLLVCTANGLLSYAMPTGWAGDPTTIRGITDCHAVAYYHDGSFALVAGVQQLWMVQNGFVASVIDSDLPGTAHSVGVSCDGAFAAACTDNDGSNGTLLIYAVSNATLRLVQHTDLQNPARALSFHPQLGFLVVACSTFTSDEDGTVVATLLLFAQATDGQQDAFVLKQTIQLGSEIPRTVSFSPAGTLLLLASESPDGNTGRRSLFSFDNVTEALSGTATWEALQSTTAAVFHPKKPLFATGGITNRINWYKYTDTGTVIALPFVSGPLASVTSLATTRSGNLFAANSADGRTYLYSLPAERFVVFQNISNRTSAAPCVAYGGNRISFGGLETLTAVCARNGMHTPFNCEEHNLRAVSIALSDSLLAAMLTNGTLAVHDFGTGMWETHSISFESVTRVVIAQASNQLALMNSEEAYVYDLPAMVLRQKLICERSTVEPSVGIGFSAGSNFFAVARGDIICLFGRGSSEQDLSPVATLDVDSTVKAGEFHTALNLLAISTEHDIRMYSFSGNLTDIWELRFTAPLRWPVTQLTFHPTRMLLLAIAAHVAVAYEPTTTALLLHSVLPLSARSPVAAAMGTDFLAISHSAGNQILELSETPFVTAVWDDSAVDTSTNRTVTVNTLLLGAPLASVSMQLNPAHVFSTPWSTAQPVLPMSPVTAPIVPVSATMDIDSSTTVPLSLDVSALLSPECITSGINTTLYWTCSNGTYISGYTCLSCPVCAVCDGTRTLRVASGCHRSFVAPAADDSDETGFYYCFYSSRCQGGENAGECAEGYDPSSIGCSLCVAGYAGGNSEECSKCPSTPVLVLLATLKAVAFLLTVGFTALPGLLTASGQSSSDKTFWLWRPSPRIGRTVVTFLQTSFVISRAMPYWPASLTMLGTAAGQFTSVQPSSGLNCVVDITSGSLVASVLLSFAACSAALPVLWRNFSGVNTDRVIAVLMAALFVMYPSLSDAGLRLIRCVTVNGQEYLASDFRVKCTSKEFTLLRGVGLAVTGFAAVFPLGLFLLARHGRDRQSGLSAPSSASFAGGGITKDPSAVARYGILLQGYRPEVYYWEAVIGLRKFAIVALCRLFTPYEASLQLPLLATVLFVELQAAWQLQPFSQGQWAEVMALVALLLKLIAGHQFTGDKEWGPDEGFSLRQSVQVIQQVIEVLLAGMDCIVMGLLVVSAAYSMFTKAQRIMRRKEETAPLFDEIESPRSNLWSLGR
eukprot:TRINITY_DN16382_c0_g1_i1.p1 TRINITY_DN16382_c0_g1~~TRINITY_DN16382_c0_g1_i1.p1  ORF type:complete len:1591 (+),score=211.65 TRINITY_DN16382_c0_g1_i1:16-4788(+)